MVIAARQQTAEPLRAGTPPGGPLDTAILHLFERAVAEGHLAVAEHLMQALEELAAAEPDCECVVQRAYLHIADGTATRKRRVPRGG